MYPIPYNKALTLSPIDLKNMAGSINLNRYIVLKVVLVFTAVRLRM